MSRQTIAFDTFTRAISDAAGRSNVDPAARPVSKRVPHCDCISIKRHRAEGHGHGWMLPTTAAADGTCTECGHYVIYMAINGGTSNE